MPVAHHPRSRPGPPPLPAADAAAPASDAAAAAADVRSGGAATAAPARPAPAADDSIDLGATVLPVLVKNYAPYAVAALAGLVLGWLLGRRRS